MKNTIKEKQMFKLYENFEKMDLEQFREFCKELIGNSRQKNAEILHNIPNMTKKQLLFSMNNFAMKGQGFGVL